jgi:hypothetical protein
MIFAIKSHNDFMKPRPAFSETGSNPPQSIGGEVASGFKILSPFKIWNDQFRFKLFDLFTDNNIVQRFYKRSCF